MNKIFIKKKEKKKPIKEKKIFFSFLLMALILIVISYYDPKDKVSAPDKTIYSSSDILPKETAVLYEKTDKTDTPNEETYETEIIKQIDNVLDNALEDKNKMSKDSPAVNEKQIISNIILPIKGEIIKPFSDTELIYSETMGDFRTHSGIDISAKIGENVCSPANGRITEISKDEKLGYTIIIDHGNMISKISNLSSQIDVKTGDKVSSGSKIALVGDTAEYEILDPPHIHYELIKNGVSVNPIEYIE